MDPLIPTITTTRLRLGPLGPQHFEAFARHQADPDLQRYIRSGQPQDRATAWVSLATTLGHWALRGYGFWAVEEPDGTLVGRVGFVFLEGWPGPEFGWLIAKERQGRGYATEAAAAALAYGMARWKFPRLVCLIRPENEASIRVAQKLGCVQEEPRVADGVLNQVWRCP